MKPPAITVRAAIEASGVSQETIARRAEISIRTVHLANKHNAWPRQDRTRFALMRALGIPVEAVSCG